MTEPPINRDPDALDPIFRLKLSRVLNAMELLGFPMKLHEGFRTVERQQWLYAQGRTRSGPKVTFKDGVDNNPADGVNELSNHQGDGKPGTGRGADCYPVHPDTFKIIWPPPKNKDPIWNLFATIAESQGLTAGYRWKAVDSPHVELKA